MKVLTTAGLTKLIQLCKNAIPTVNNPTITITQGGVTKGSFTLNQASGDTIALDSGGGYHPDLFTWQWADHQLNDVQWLRADTFSWQDGSVYEAAYDHLEADIIGKTLTSETVAGVTVQFYLADDGHKICPDTEESNVASIYTATGVAWYYIIDTVNERFKLPRTKFGVTGLRDTVGNYVAAGLPNVDAKLGGYFQGSGGAEPTEVSNVKFVTNASGTSYAATYPSSKSTTAEIDMSLTSDIYGNGTTVQPPATQMYLYFYVGSFTQTALENTAGLNAELFNGKADTNLMNTAANVDFVVERQEPTAQNNYTWYRKYKSGWVEQGGRATTNSGNPCQVVLPIEMADTYYNINILGQTSTDGYSNAQWQVMSISTASTPKSTTGFYGQPSITGYNLFFYWEVRGMAA